MKKTKSISCLLIIMMVIVLFLPFNTIFAEEDNQCHFSISYDKVNWIKYEADFYGDSSYGYYNKTHFDLDTNQKFLYLRVDSFIENGVVTNNSQMQLSFQNYFGYYNVEKDNNGVMMIPVDRLNLPRDRYDYITITGVNKSVPIEFGTLGSGPQLDYSNFSGIYLDDQGNQISIDSNGKVIIKDMTISNESLEPYNVIYKDGTVKMYNQLYIYTHSANLLFTFNQSKGTITFDKNLNDNTNIPSFLTKGTIFKKQIATENISLNKTVLSLEKGNIYQLKATLNPSTSTAGVKWSSSDVSKVTVDNNGNINALQEGKATITATSSQQTANCEVMIVKPVEVEMLPPIDESSDKIQIETNTATTEVLNNIIETILSSDEKTGTISNQTKQNINNAILSGKTISTEIQAGIIDENNIDATTMNKIDHLIDDLATKNDSKVVVAQYLDLGIAIKADNTELGHVLLLPEPIQFTVMIPSDLMVKGRQFFVVREHDGETEILPTTISDNKVMFETDRFSTYAIVYEDKIVIDNYTVTFVGKDNQVLKVETIKEGESATPPQAPYIKGYKFVKWDTNYQNVTSHLTVKAIYEKIVNTNIVNTNDNTQSPTGYLIVSMSSLFIIVYCLMLNIKTKKED